MMNRVTEYLLIHFCYTYIVFITYLLLTSSIFANRTYIQLRTTSKNTFYYIARLRLHYTCITLYYFSYAYFGFVCSTGDNKYVHIITMSFFVVGVFRFMRRRVL